MHALVVKKKGNYELIQTTIPEPEEGEVLIKVDSCGLCGTDVHIYQGKFFASYPVIIGHEISGHVEKTGTGVSGLTEGTPVVVNPNMHCGVCPPCRQGKIHLCQNLLNVGVRVNGGFAQYVKVNHKYVHSVSFHTDLEVACLTEPVSCCVHGVDRAGIKSGDEVLILGAGSIGLIILQLVKLQGVSKVIVVDPVEEKRELAQKLGADFVFDPDKEDIFSSTKQVFSHLPQAVFECVGKNRTMHISWQLVGPGGSVVWFGVADPEESVPIKPYEMFRKELTIVGSFINPYTTRRAVRLIEAKKLRLKQLVTHRFSLEQFSQALYTFEKDESRIKIVMKP